MAETQTFSCGALPSLSLKSNLSVKNDTFDRHMLPSDRLDLKLEVKAGDDPGTFEGYGAIFGNRDNDNDIVVKGAFADSLQARMPAMLWQHNMKEPIGRFMDVREDDKGLYVRGKLSMKGKGAEAYELLSMGAMDGLSIGFVTKEATRDAATGTRTIHKADLMEISLVTFPANEMARIESVKAANMIADERAFERFLRSSGFSRNRAKTITAKGFKADMNTSMKGNMMATDAAEIAELVQNLDTKRDGLLAKNYNHLYSEKSIFNSLKKFFDVAPAINRVSLFPGQTERGIAIIPVAPGEVTFKVDIDGNPDNVKFTCRVNYDRFEGTRLVKKQVILTERRPSIKVDRGIRRSLLPGTNVEEIFEYLQSLPRNLLYGTTSADLTFHEFGKDDPRSISRSKTTFRLMAVSRQF